MEVFIILLLKLIPLYLIIALGFLSVKWIRASKETVASLLIYIVSPFVFFLGTYKTELTISSVSLPIIIYIISAIVGVLFLMLGKATYKDSNANILSLSSSIGNAGYFGLPVALFLFNEQVFVLAVFAVLGLVIYMNTLGFYILAKGRYSAKESLIKLLKLPAIYAFLLGILFNILNLNLDESIMATLELFKGTYSILGMMIIGMGLATVKLRHLDVKFIGLSFLARFIVWPMLALLTIYLDMKYFGLFDMNMQRVLILFSIVPIAANSVSFATELKTHPEKVAIAVFVSTLFCLFYIPLIASIFLQ